MYYIYDDYGRFAGTSPTATARGTTVQPDAETSDYNFNGVAWVYAPNVQVSRVAGGQAVPATVQDHRITRLAFRNRFTSVEKVAIEIAALDDPTAPMPQRAQAAALRANQADLAAATFVDLARPDTRAGVQMLEAAGLLGAGRALEILDTPAQPHESPL